MKDYIEQLKKDVAARGEETGALDIRKTKLEDNLNAVDLKKFIGYLIEFPVVSVRKRVGFFLQELGCQSKILKSLRRSIGEKRVLVLLDPFSRSRKGKINKEWKIIVNR